MEIVEKKIEEIREYRNNPRINEGAVGAVAESIKEFGFRQPVVIDKSGVIVAGHTRVKAARMLGMESVPCIMADDLNEEQIKAYRLVDNKTNELSFWDIGLMEEELRGIFDIDMSAFGFFNEEDDDETFVSDSVQGDVPFTEVLREEHNYVVLYFDNDVDWLQAETMFGIRSVKALSTRKDGKISEGNKKVGIGRVLNGAQALEKIRVEYQG